MPAARLLGPGDALPTRPRRVLVAGATAAGKTTVAVRVAALLGLPYTEIDGLYHGPGWVPRESFVDDVLDVVAGDAWVMEWQYSVVRDRVADRADLLVWLDVSRARVLRQVTGRTLRRRVFRVRLWHGNVEPPLRTIFTEPDHIVRWAWRSHARVAPRVVALQERRPDLPVVRLRSRREVRRWLQGPLAATAR